MRVKYQLTIVCFWTVRITPARAGKIKTYLNTAAVYAGSPPLVRVKFSKVKSISSESRITPARAGKIHIIKETMR